MPYTNTSSLTNKEFVSLNGFLSEERAMLLIDKEEAFKDLEGDAHVLEEAKMEDIDVIRECRFDRLYEFIPKKYHKYLLEAESRINDYCEEYNRGVEHSNHTIDNVVGRLVEAGL